MASKRSLVKSIPVRRPRATAIVQAEHDATPVHLSASERTLLNEALRRGEDLREQVESAVTSFGRWILGEVFHDDAAAALDGKTDNPVWRELVRRAGGPTLRVNRHTLYVALQVAARDKRITDQAWRGLDAGRKELLLPLSTDERLRDAAQHVSKFNLTHASTRQYVTEVLKGSGQTKRAHITVPRLVQRVHTLHQLLGGAAVLRKVQELRSSVDAAERGKAADEVEKLRSVLGEISKALRKR